MARFHFNISWINPEFPQSRNDIDQHFNINLIGTRQDSGHMWEIGNTFLSHSSHVPSAGYKTVQSSAFPQDMALLHSTGLNYHAEKAMAPSC